MAKSGLTASISLLLTRADGFISGTISSQKTNRSWFGSISYTGSLINLQSRRVEILRRSFHSHSDEEDAFAELGTPVGVAQGVGLLPKLMTEKPECVKKKQKANSGRKASHATRSRLKGCPSLTDILLACNTASPAISEHLKNHNDVSIDRPNNKSASDFSSPNRVVIENVPSTINDAQIKEAVLAFGEISSVSMKTIPNELSCCNVEFKNIESYRRAVSVSEISVGSLHLPIRPLHVTGIATIRISNISTETADPEIQSTCMLYGRLEGLVRTEEDAIDAFFIVKDDLDAQRILEKLNSTVINGSQWSTHLQPTHVDLKNEDDAHCKLGSEITRCIAGLKTQISMKKICAEDLEYLHSCIMHLEDHPASTSLLPE